MKKLVLVAFMCCTPLFMNAKGGFGESFGGAFFGSTLSNVIMQPRGCSQGQCYQQPIQTRVVEVHRPTYVVESPRVESPRPRYAHGRIHYEDHNSTAQKEKELAIREKEIEIKRLEAENAKLLAEKAKADAENEQLKLKLQLHQAQQSKK